MINRIVDFSEAPARLRVRCAQLIVEREDLPEVSMPLADLAVIVVAHPQVTFSQAVLSGLAAAGGVFVACDGFRLPVGMMLPLAAHHAQSERFIAQARSPLPVRKRLWRQIVRSKIQAQAALLVELRGRDFGLKALVTHVRSGDPANVEARAARRYWPALFADLKFRRQRDNEDQNVLLNYGYAVLRAIVARAISAAGLHPSLGIHHHNRYDSYCLADDLMEPFRATVDHAVVEYMSDHDEPYGLEAAAKQQIISELTGRYVIGGELRTLFDVATRMAASLADVFLGEAEKLELPDFEHFPKF
jgi:CRISPR-associated protein Cas1